MWDVLYGVAKWHGMYVQGDKNSMGCYDWGDKKSMGCFVRGGKSLWDVLSGVSKNGMGCFVQLPFTMIYISKLWSYSGIVTGNWLLLSTD